jgi:hypothetical protein
MPRLPTPAYAMQTLETAYEDSEPKYSLDAI